MVDLLSSEYGWTKDYVYEHVYFDEFFYLKKEIQKRHKTKLLESITIQHGDPKELIKNLRNEDDESYVNEAKLDKSAFRQFKEKITSGSGFVVKS